MSLIEEIKKSISPKFTREVLIEVLKKKSGFENIQIKKIDCKDKTSKNVEYLSTLCRFTVEASGRNKEGKIIPIFLPLIAKSIPTNVARRKTFRSNDFFQTEIYFYEHIWPKMKKLKATKMPNNSEEDEVPEMLSCYSDGLNDYIVFEDLTFKGYDTTEKGEGVDLKHATLFLKLLANFHALGIACRLQDPEFETVAQSIKETYFDEKFRPWFERFINNNLLEIYRHAVKKFLPEIYLDKLNKLFANDLYGFSGLSPRSIPVDLCIIENCILVKASPNVFAESMKCIRCSSTDYDSPCRLGTDTTEFECPAHEQSCYMEYFYGGSEPLYRRGCSPSDWCETQKGQHGNDLKFCKTCDGELCDTDRIGAPDSSQIECYTCQSSDSDSTCRKGGIDNPMKVCKKGITKCSYDYVATSKNDIWTRGCAEDNYCDQQSGTYRQSLESCNYCSDDLCNTQGMSISVS